MISARYRFFSALLLACWLAASQHCALEASGLFAGHGTEAEAATGCCNTQQAKGCETDSCETVEGGQYRSESQAAKSLVPEWSAEICALWTLLLVAPPAEDAALAASAWQERAPEWVPAWQFERRAAGLAHAPDTLIA